MTINNFTDGLFKHAKISFNYIVLCIYFLEDLCQLNDNKTGVCLSISKCWTEINMEILKWLAQNNSLITCSFIDYTPLICCPTNFIPGMIAKSSKILFVFLIIIIFILKSSFLYFFFIFFSECKEYAAVYHFCDTAWKLVFDKSNKTEKFPFTVR